MCPKCGAERSGESCPKCGLVFAKFNPEVLERNVPEALKGLFRETSKRWDDDDLHDRFVEQALAAGQVDFAARCYRQRGDDEKARQQLAKIEERMLAMAAGLAQTMTVSRENVRPRGRTPLVTAITLILFLLVLAGFSFALLKMLK
jgi:hypothetical protein